MGAPDLAVRLGAPINLTCVISHTADQLQFVFWYRNDRMINYDIANEKRGKIVLSKWHNSSSRAGAPLQDTIASNLQIYSSRLADSGNYTCQPSGARSASVDLHVLEGELSTAPPSCLSGAYLGATNNSSANAPFHLPSNLCPRSAR